MEHRDDAEPAARGEARHPHRRDLVGEVEERGRLVEEQDARLLRERAGEEDAAPLAAGEGVEAAVGEVDEVARRERAVDRAAVEAGSASARSPCRGARPIITASRTVNGQETRGSCGTSAQSCATVRRGAVARVEPGEPHLAAGGRERGPRRAGRAWTCRRRSARAARRTRPRAPRSDTSESARAAP